ncbi:GntR family transcriptional regulator [Streptomyces sp. HUAS ZL42]|uniref:GntR family transcriptional regulator n=1 Tax=Streptomyces sp. HUAS ZL42 TaxID=3231715 RepID=UPI00345ED7C3
MIEFAEDRPKWEQITDVIRARITDGTYAPRSRVPSVVALTSEFGVAGVTARKALAALRETGEIYTVTGMGSFVADKATEDQDQPPKA